MRGHSQHEVAAQREAREHQRHTREPLRQRAHRAHHFRQAAGMEQLAIEVMRGAVIAQVEAHDFEALLEQGLRHRQHIRGIGAAFPAVQQHREPFAGFTPAPCRAGMKALQRHAIAAFEQQFSAGRAYRKGTPLHTGAARRQRSKGWSGGAGRAASARVETSCRAGSPVTAPG